MPGINSRALFHTTSRLLSLFLFSILIACSQSPSGAQNAPGNLTTEAGNTEKDSTGGDEVASLPGASKTSMRDQPKKALPTLHEMIGLDRGQVSALLGKPRFRRQDSPADLWQYGNGKCVLDLFLYKIRDGSVYKVTHVEVRPLNGAKITKDVCFEGLIRAHNDLGAG